MKIGITGHTQGFGKSLYDVFNSQKHDTLGFSRSNGFDIGNKLVRKKIINEIKDIDVFINNAYDPQGQLDILEEVLSCWSGTEKIVVNVSSIIVNKESPYFEGELAVYRESKIKLNNIIKNYKGSVKILCGFLLVGTTLFWLNQKESIEYSPRDSSENSPYKESHNLSKKERFEAALRRKQLSLVLAGKLNPNEATALKALFN